MENKDEYIEDLENRIVELENEIDKLRNGEQEDSIRFYKVKGTNGGFSKGGQYPSFTQPGSKQSGKTWSGTGPLKSHLNQFAKHTGKGNEYKFDEKTRSWEVIEIVSFPAKVTRVWDLFGADSDGVFERKKK
jgi:hypothetical protein